jgi:hypothetical protein
MTWQSSAKSAGFHFLARISLSRDKGKSGHDRGFGRTF